MPWLIRQITMDQRQIYWTQIEAANGESFDVSSMSDPVADIDDRLLPISITQSTNHKKIPDVIAGPSNELIISQTLRSLIEEWDPVEHRYYPVTIHSKHQGTVEDTYFIFKFGSFIHGGVIEEKSKVFPKYDANGVLHHYGSPAKPKITWRSSAINGRHVWTDFGLNDRFFVSDVFFEQMNKSRMGSFDAVESFQE